MNARTEFYNRTIQIIQHGIGLPQTREDEDKTLRQILSLLTQLRDSYMEETEQAQPEQPLTLEQRILRGEESMGGQN